MPACLKIPLLYCRQHTPREYFSVEDRILALFLIIYNGRYFASNLKLFFDFLFLSTKLCSLLLFAYRPTEIEHVVNARALLQRESVAMQESLSTGWKLQNTRLQKVSEHILFSLYWIFSRGYSGKLVALQTFANHALWSVLVHPNLLMLRMISKPSCCRQILPILIFKR